MKIVIAPDSYKGCLTAIEVSQIMKDAIYSEIPTVDIVLNPMADGGEGTLESLIIATQGIYEIINVTGPLGNVIQSRYGILGINDTAIIEVASICGLPMVPMNSRNPMNTTTFGIGEAIKHALNQGLKRIILGIGGSATNDGGLGMLQALGAVFMDNLGRPVQPTGKGLQDIKTVNFDTIDHRLKECELIVACDVNNPLCGPNGASYIFGSQKGATPHQIRKLDSWLKHYAALIEEELGVEFQNVPGSGAAGGLGFALLTIGARLESGAEIVSSATDLTKKLADANWVFTGEGQSDDQTLYGKVPAYVARVAKEHGCRTILISGSLGKGFEKLDGLFTSCHSTVLSPMSMEIAMEQARNSLFETTRNIAKLLKILPENL
ncbi:glycerate kinase [Bacillus sp. OxB-1]|uniref:glycerate kinase n=1 Tax=Bacillus sp. (strain OxB-1) TaxID=98228 RepID=UPI000581CEB6|nr:glycerate kinase [Bacillus sp. OxB-1]BAQ11632.1 glycerate kinase [Bacillus sp. OxB-1]